MSVLTNKPIIEFAGENALIVYFKQDTLIEANKKISQLTAMLKLCSDDRIIDLIPSYISLLIIFDPINTDYWAIKRLVALSLSSEQQESTITSKVIDIPVFYSIQTGPELNLIANQAGLSVDEVIHIHQQNIYQVFALGFAPGFAFLGEVDERIATPRLATPRQKVPKGAVGIADRQTAIYPTNSPGGWNLIGLCPLSLFDPSTSPHIPFTVGDKVKFNAVSKQEFIALGGQLDG